ncbi:MAG: hypothetical protein AB7L09_03385 [Nitrospira sp.]
MRVVPKSEREWVEWLKARVASREQICMAGCGDPATKIKFLGKRTGAFCGGCYSELYHGKVPPLDRPKGLKRVKRR